MPSPLPHQVALSRMGAPLLAGALTTGAAAISLSLCTFDTLRKLGFFMAFASGWYESLDPEPDPRPNPWQSLP